MGEAESLYRQILSHQPRHADALHLLGVLAHQIGRNSDAAGLVRQAISINPNDPAYHSNLGIILSATGQLDEAAAAQRRALSLRPEYIEARNNLAGTLLDMGRIDEAISEIRRVLDAQPGYANAHNNLGNALRQQGNLHEAIAAYRRAIASQPDYVEARSNLGNALRENGQIDEAIAELQKALSIRPDYPDALNNLGTALEQSGRLDDAIAAYRRAVTVRPEMIEAHFNLGSALIDRGDLDEGIAALQQAAKLRPTHADTHHRLGWALKERGRLEDSIAASRRAIELRPDYPDTYNNLGNALSEMGRQEEALAAYRKALDLRPDFAAALNNLGNVLKDRGELDEALACLRKAAEMTSDARIAGNLLFTLHYHPEYGPKELLEEHVRWNRTYAAPLADTIRPYENDSDPNRRLRIGYVSPDLREHPVGRFMVPLLENHDHANVEVFCYSDVRRPDALTQRLQSHADVWRSTSGLSDEALAERVRADRIDILVDLIMHLQGTRIMTFARKPAPVQVTYLAYAGTTGLRAMDYRLTDPYLDSPGEGDEFYVERSIRLPQTYWCYQPVDGTPEVAPLPALANGCITFGCLNNFGKITGPTIAAWSRLLNAMPNSRLLLACLEGPHRRRARDQLGADGIDPARLEFFGRGRILDYLEQYHRIDIGLDPFPYPGATTTCDALWMGVPVVSLAGKTAVSRAGLSILSNIGLSELVARDSQQYVELARTLASDLPRLAALRSTLRDRMRMSPLMDAPQFARDVETAYRQMWRQWCESPSS